MVEHRMLLAARLMIRRDVDDSPVLPKEVPGLSVDVHDLRRLLLLREAIEAPLDRRQTCLRRLGVFERDPILGVVLHSKKARGLKAGLLLGRGLLFARSAATLPLASLSLPLAEAASIRAVSQARWAPLVPTPRAPSEAAAATCCATTASVAMPRLRSRQCRRCRLLIILVKEARGPEGAGRLVLVRLAPALTCSPAAAAAPASLALDLAALHLLLLLLLLLLLPLLLLLLMLLLLLLLFSPAVARRR
mmetsp:Transcript_81504/g.174642  ORF Transcript_81504/g.174642 Transcript_81504/m.174642 type:complete len:248 (+) Transcript_81504:299-1042(+)